MATVSTSDFRKGLKVMLDGEPYEILSCEFRKPGKGQAIYSLRLKNLLKGTNLDRNYKSGDSLEAADVHRGEGQYLYRDGSGFVFMDNESFEQYTLPEEAIGTAAHFLQEGATCELLYWNQQLIDFTPPSHVIVEVTYAEPAARGDTAGNVTKPAEVSTGTTVQVPAFVKQGDKIKVDARTGEYVERANE